MRSQQTALFGQFSQRSDMTKSNLTTLQLKYFGHYKMRYMKVIKSSMTY